MPRNLFFAVRFYSLCAEVVVRRIVRLNGGAWPRTLSQWQVVAGRLRYVLLVVADEPRIRSMCLFGERVIFIQAHSNERTMLRQTAHEVAHAVIAVSGPIGRLLEWPQDEDEAHYVATLVENCVDVAMVEDSQLELFSE